MALEEEASAGSAASLLTCMVLPWAIEPSW